MEDLLYSFCFASFFASFFFQFFFVLTSFDFCSVDFEDRRGERRKAQVKSTGRHCI